jgi:hypothetical protein
MKNFYLLIVLMSLSAVAPVAAQNRIDLRGIVKDERGGLIVAATITVEVDCTANLGCTRNRLETQSDAGGEFRFRGLTNSLYLVRITAKGFAHSEQTFEPTKELPLLEVTLFPLLEENVTITYDQHRVSLDPERAAGTSVLREADLSVLPDDSDELSQRLQLMSASSGGIPGGAVVTVDGFLVHGRLPSKGSIREIRINPDLYSAEYDRAPYRGGRIEILTKPGAASFHGSGFFNYNNAVVNARNAFAPTRPDANSRRYGLDFGGPIVAKKAGYFVSFERREIDDSSAINALILDSNFQAVSDLQNATVPARLAIASARFDWQVNPRNTLLARYDFSSNRLENQGVGGFNLADRGFDSRTSEHSFRFSTTTVLGTTMVNEFRGGITLRDVTIRAVSSEQAIVVPGAFASGGAATQSQLSDDFHLELANNFSLVVGKHKLKLGVQVLGRVSDDSRRDNFNGTFIFGGGPAPQLDALNQAVGSASVNISGLEQYRRTLLSLPGGIPTRFTITTGDPLVNVEQWIYFAFAQDEWKLKRNVALSFGLRYEGQTNPTDRLSLAPRFGVAYSPDKKQLWVLRARVGLFYTRIPDSLSFDVQRLNGERQQSLVINRPSFPNPFNGGQSLVIRTTREFEPGIRAERSWQGQLALEHQLPRGWRLNVSHSYSSSNSGLRSVNINAPVLDGVVDPALAPRPSGMNENVFQYQSSGATRGSVTFAGINHSGSSRFNIYTGYLHFDFRSNADTPATTPQSTYSDNGEWARPYWQATHRAFVAGVVFLPGKLRASPSLNFASGTPFNITTGIDNNGDGSFTDRPSFVGPGAIGAISTPFGEMSPNVINGTLARNFGTSPATATLDLDLARDFVFGRKGATNDGRYTLTLNVRTSNLTNRVNVGTLNGVLTSQFFNRANSAAPARKIEFGLRLAF